MGFDKNSTQPIVQPSKKTTKVNIGMIIGILFFFILGGFGVRWFWLHHEDAKPVGAATSGG